MTEPPQCCKCSECELSFWCEATPENLAGLKRQIDYLKPVAQHYLAMFGKHIDSELAALAQKIPRNGV